MAIKPMVIAVESANGPPICGIIPFHDIRIITGTNNEIITDRRLLNKVATSALNKVINTVDVLGITVSIFDFNLGTHSAAG